MHDSAPCHSLFGSKFSPQGSYTFGETQDYSIEIAGLIDTALTTNISCNGADDGIIEIVPGAFAPAGSRIFYHWNDGSFSIISDL